MIKMVAYWLMADVSTALGIQTMIVFAGRREKLITLSAKVENQSKKHDLYLSKKKKSKS